ncbi:alkylhydroperoxidase AhpD family core domain protein [Sphingobacterium spiritivorum ATCC 33300]|uniref:Alkylhydroperoxidase AhpD family core domain protein n=1 Tax=Sphingobacterium spiritivorum ATCC 33300 TaxID=525372 RepID=C2G4C0_SPHSI|nr:carboxymuconolactone decarboxylase family protein [Sphingobacterium spiritivorum]EEI90038.1 alkylhydroperoxidase AhpD family core domain protein [Sphingobacterium spiritivorum ATCC 33300]QQS94943.1 carboxymuconolactone decarboxylase family protein [Sphingobacterium spiritivorum]
MSERINIAKSEPQGYKAMSGLEQYIQASDVSKTHLELIKIRASQINGCAFCLDMHTKDALKKGETNQRIFLLNAWKETTLFTEEERVILSMTEEVTLIHEHGLSEATYLKAVELLGEQYVAQVLMVIVTINGWNRIAVSMQYQIPE